MDHAIPDCTTIVVDDRAILLRWVEARDATTVAIVLPAMGVPARHYDGLATALAANGLHALVVEFPGQGDSPAPITRDTAIGYRDLVEGEVSAAVEHAADRWPDHERVLVGHSLGGQVALLYAANNPDRVGGIVLPAAGTIHWRAYPGIAAPVILATTQAARLVARVAGVFPGDRLGFGGRQPRQLISDWAHAGLTGRWEPTGSTVDHQARLARLDLPILSLTMDGDTFAPPSATAALTSLAPAADVHRIRVATDASGRAAHFAWLRAPGPVVAEIRAWLDDRSS